MPSTLLPSNKAASGMTLFDWIASSDPNHSLVTMAEEVRAQLEGVSAHRIFPVKLEEIERNNAKHVFLFLLKFSCYLNQHLTKPF